MNVHTWFVLVAAVVCSWLAVNRLAFRDLMSPFNLLLPAWILPLLLKMLHLSTKEQPWRTETILMVAWVTFSMAGISLLSALLLRPGGRSRRRAIFERSQEIARTGLFQVLVVAMFALGLVGYFYFEFYTNPIGIPIVSYLRDPNIVRDPLWQWGKDIKLWPIPSMALACVPVLYFISLAEKGWIRRGVFLALALIYPLAALAKMSRMDFLYAVSMAALVRYYVGRNLSVEVAKPAAGIASFKRAAKKTALVVVVAALIVASGTIFSEIRGNRAFGDLSRRLGMNVNLDEPIRSVVVEVYGYFALPFENLSNFVNSYPGGWHPGVGLLRPAYSFFQLGSIPKDELDQIDFPLLILPINTSPFIALNYAELGWLGVFIAPIIYACLINAIYVSFRNRPTLVALLAYAAVPIGWLWIATNAEFTGIRYYFYLVFPMFLMVIYNTLRPARGAVRASHAAA